MSNVLRPVLFGERSSTGRVGADDGSAGIESILGLAADVHLRELSVSGARVQVRMVGTGPIGIVLLHGWACSSLYWLPVLKRLPVTEVTAVAVDLPGFGGSGVSRGPWSFEACAEVVGEVVRSLDLPTRTLVVGHSMGGAVALTLADRLPFEQVVLEGYCPMPPSLPERIERLRLLREEGTCGPWIESMVRSWCVRTMGPNDVAILAGVARNVSVEVLVRSMYCILEGVPLGVEVRQCKGSAWVFGLADSHREMSAVEAMAEELGANLTVMGRSGHTPHVDEPDAFVDFVMRRALGRPDGIDGDGS